MFSIVRGLLAAALLGSPALARAEAAPTAAASAAVAPPTLRVYMRSDVQPLTFSTAASSARLPLNSCVSPCDVLLSPGKYVLRLNGVLARDSFGLQHPGTLYGRYHSRRAARDGGFLALNVGGILGGVFITVAALGGPKWAYAAGGGAVAAGGAIFLIAYRSDRATVSFSPFAPVDVRGMPSPPVSAGNVSGAAFERSSGVAQARGLGLRVTF